MYMLLTLALLRSFFVVYKYTHMYTKTHVGDAVLNA